MKLKCCICNITFDGYGNNPYPIKKDGVCCPLCNIEIVIPMRFIKLRNKEAERGFTYCDMED